MDGGGSDTTVLVRHAQSRPAIQAGSPWTRRDLALALALFALAVAVRLPYLTLVPRYTDEVRRILWSVQIGEGGFWPLAYKNGYNGPAMLYLTALALKVAPAVATPRFVALLVSSLTVPVTYGAGRALGGRAAGTVAGLLLATSFIPVVVFGHVVWAITFGALAVVGAWWATALAVRGASQRWLVGAAFLAGLAVQSHPVAVFQLPGLALWVLAQPSAVRRPLVRALPRAAAAAALAYSPIVLYQLQAWRTSGTSALTTTRDLRAGGLLNLGAYAAGLRDMLGSLVDSLSGAGHHAGAPAVADPVAWVVVPAVAVALVLLAVRGPRLPLCVLASAVLLQPFVIREYNFPLSARYVGLVVPAAYLAIGLAAAEVWRIGRIPRVAAVGGIVAAMAVLSVVRIAAFYRNETANGKTNAPIIALAAACRDGFVVLDDEIGASFSASGNVSRVLEALLALQRTPHEKASTPAEMDEILAERSGSACVIVSDEHRAVMRLGKRLAPVEGQAVAAGDDGDGYGVYRWVP